MEKLTLNALKAKLIVVKDELAIAKEQDTAVSALLAKAEKASHCSLMDNESLKNLYWKLFVNDGHRSLAEVENEIAALTLSVKNYVRANATKILSSNEGYDEDHTGLIYLLEDVCGEVKYNNVVNRRVKDFESKIRDLISKARIEISEDVIIAARKLISKIEKCGLLEGKDKEKLVKRINKKILSNVDMGYSPVSRMDTKRFAEKRDGMIIQTIMLANKRKSKTTKENNNEDASYEYEEVDSEVVSENEAESITGGITLNIDTLNRSVYVREFIDAATLVNTTVAIKNVSGKHDALVRRERVCKDIISLQSRWIDKIDEEHSENRLALIGDTGVIKVVNETAKFPIIYWKYDVDNTWRKLDDELTDQGIPDKQFKENEARVAEMVKAARANNAPVNVTVDTYVMFDRATSGKRGLQTMFMRVDPDKIAEFDDLYNRKLNLATGGGWDILRPLLATPVLFSKGVKKLERVILTLTDATIYENVVRSFAYCNFEWELGPWQNVFADGHFMINHEVAHRIYKDVFGVDVEDESLYDGWLMQCRIYFTKGECKIMSKKSMKTFIESTAKVCGCEVRFISNEFFKSHDLDHEDKAIYIVGTDNLEDVDVFGDQTTFKALYDFTNC